METLTHKSMTMAGAELRLKIRLFGELFKCGWHMWKSSAPLRNSEGSTPRETDIMTKESKLFCFKIETNII